MAYRYLAVIPAYNEEATIEQVVRLSQRHADVCVVDDASKDRTGEIASRIPGVHYIRHAKNTHIPGAILDGMRLAIQGGYDFCITLDAGMSHDPGSIPKFQNHSDAALVIGYRQAKVNVPHYRRLLSWAGNVLLNFALNVGKKPQDWAKLRDVTSGYRMYSREACNFLLQRKMQSRSFDFHLEALAYIHRGGMKVAEVPIVYVYSNSSLRWRVIGDALKTYLRILFTRKSTYTETAISIFESKT
jgi:dolichol-phosphate mannosyltransferase